MGGAASTSIRHVSTVSEALTKARSDLKQGDNASAITLYTVSLNILEGIPGKHDDGTIRLISEIYSERSLAFLGNGQSISAILDADRAIELCPTSVSSYGRASKVYFGAGLHQKALELIDKAIALTSNSIIIENDFVQSAQQDSYDEKPLQLSLQSLQQLRKDVVDKLSPTSGAAGSVGIGNTYSWGQGRDGVLGLGDATIGDKPFPVIIPVLRNKQVIEIACGGMHSVCVTYAGELYAWGNNTLGQLGLGVTGTRHGDVNTNSLNSTTVYTPTLVPKLVGLRVVAVAAGAAHTIALTSESRERIGIVYSWGLNNQGQLGLSKETTSASVKETQENVISSPTLIEALHNLFVNIQAVSCGIAHTVFLSDDGHIYSCGLNSFGQLGLGEGKMGEQTVDLPTLVSDFDRQLLDIKIVHIACGAAHTLFVESGGLCFATGSNSCGQLGLGNLKDYHTFQLIKSLEDVPISFVACGEEFSAVVTRSKRVYTFGLGLGGQLGDGELTPSRRDPFLVSELDGKNVETISCSQGQVFATTSMGEIWTWGLPADKATLSSFDDSAVIRKPEKMSFFDRKKNIMSFACGRKHYLVLVHGPYGPHCLVTFNDQKKKRFHDDDYDDDQDENKERESGHGGGGIILVAGKRAKFTIQAKNTLDEACTSGGCLFHCTLTHSSVNYEFAMKKFKEDESKNGTRKDGDSVLIDDNFDGTYAGSLELFLVGTHTLSITLCDIPLYNSPFDIEVVPGPVYPPKCTAWWGQFAKRASAYEEKDENNKNSQLKNNGGGYGSELFGIAGQSIVFTVSVRDRGGNRCYSNDATFGKSVVIEGYRCPHSADVDADSVIISENSIFKVEWDGSSNGVFPCSFPCPTEPGEYIVAVGIDNIKKGSQIRGSPFRLLVVASSPPPSLVASEKEDSSTADHALGPSHESMQEMKGESALTEAEEELSKFERTRRRAAQALRQTQMKLAMEREQKRKAQAVKRIGGGFLVKYSKEI